MERGVARGLRSKSIQRQLDSAHNMSNQAINQLLRQLVRKRTCNVIRVWTAPVGRLSGNGD